MGERPMNQKITSFYRLTKPEKDRLIEECRKRIEAEKIKEIETVRKILEELLEEKWEKKKKTAQAETKKMLEDLQRQVTEAQAWERQRSTEAGELKKKLEAAETRNSEINGDLALANGRANNSQERLKTFEARNVTLQGKLTNAEKQVSELEGKLISVNDSNDTLRSLYNASENMVGNLRKLHSEDARRIEELESELKTKQSETGAKSEEVRKYAREVSVLEKKLSQMEEKHEKETSSAWRCGWFIGILLAAALCVSIFPTQYVTDSPVPAEQNSGVSAEYTGGGNCFDYFSGFGELRFDNGTVCQGFWANGWLAYATEYRFPDDSVYSGNMGTNSRPLGAGICTRTDGETIFGIWSWAQEKNVKVGTDDEEYIYTGLLRFGKPYGYGIFGGFGEKESFVGEFYDDMFQNGTWIAPDGTLRKINNH